MRAFSPPKGPFCGPYQSQPTCISFFFIYAYQISALYLDKQKSGAFGPTQGPLHGPKGELTHTYAYHCISFGMNSMHTKFQSFILINEKV